MKNMLPLVMIAFFTCTSCSKERDVRPVEYVNPFIGTAAYGHTSPGAALPFGMVQLCPTTGASREKAGYAYNSALHGRHSGSIMGFTHTNLSGTGFDHLAKYANILLMPTIGPLVVAPGSGDDPDSGYRSRFSHEQEAASPGYYRVMLEDYHILAELTATTRAGFHRYTFPGTDTAHIIVDLCRERRMPQLHQEAYIQIVDNKRVKGYTTVLGHHSKEPMTWYFFAEFSREFDTYGVFKEGIIEAGRNEDRGNNEFGAYLGFVTRKDEEILVKVGISFTGMDGAEKNLRAEITDWDFDHVRKEAENTWNRQLEKIKIQGGTYQNKVKFYTALYHGMLFPRTFSDANGAYYSHFADRIIQQTDFTYYVDFSIWDTYRTSHPLLTILEPQRQTDMVRTFLAMYDQGGRIPSQVSYRNFYSPIMIGDHAATTIIDTYMKGIDGFDTRKAYEAMRKNAFEPGLPDRSRPGLKEYMELGYVTLEETRESVSKTLEYAHTDGVLAQYALEMGEEEDYKILKERALNYRNLYDTLSGFYRPRFADGNWLPVCRRGEPGIVRYEDNTYYDCWDPWWIGVSPHRHYTESNAWQYLFYPQHDIMGLLELMGGEERMAERLDGLFFSSSSNSGPSYVGITGAIGQYVHGNQPSHHVAYLYNEAGKPWKTQERTRGILETLYRADEWGLPGNEDMGEQSAWFVFSALGFYPLIPGKPIYSISSPLFEKAAISLDDYYGNKTFKIHAKNASLDNKYIQNARLNGSPFERAWITHEEIVKGGLLEFEMGPEPNKNWGIQKEDVSLGNK